MFMAQQICAGILSFFLVRIDKLEDFALVPVLSVEYTL